MRLFRAIAILLALLPCLAYSPVRADDELVIGLIPEDNIFEEIKRFRAVTDHVAKKTGLRIRITVLSRYGDVIDRFTSRKLDGAFFGFFTSVLAMEKLGVVPVVRPVWEDGSSTAQSYLFVSTRSSIKSVEDMRGKRIAFVDRATMTGYLYAAAYLRDHGVRDIGSYFSDVSFTGDHSSTILAVLDHRADVGVAKSKQFQKMLRKDPVMKDELAVIDRSPAFPDMTLCLRGSLPADVRKKLQEAMVQMDRDKEGSAILKKAGIMRFDAASPEDFRPFSDIARRAGISLKTYQYRQ